MSDDARSVVLYITLLGIGAFIGILALLGMGSTYAQSPCGDAAGNIRVVYAAPWSSTQDYSDASVNKTSCISPSEAQKQDV